jgi:hypothetical protein
MVLILGIAVWFSIPYSPMKSDFWQLSNKQNEDLQAMNQVFTEEEITSLPAPLQRYFRNGGFIGKTKMLNMKLTHKDVDFILSSSMPVLNIQCVQFNSAVIPERLALIDTRLYGIPFEGLDAYQSGIGSMKGVIAKGITLFHQTGEAMNMSSLVNCLAESLLMPNMALQNFMSWESIDENKVRGTISYYDISASGIFTFDETGMLTDFSTDDRLYVDTDGNIRNVPWSAVCGDYHEVDGMMQPRALKAVWHLPEGDLVYFDGHDTFVEYNVTE